MGQAGREDSDAANGAGRTDQQLGADQRPGADRRIGARLPALAVFAVAALLVIAIAGLGRIDVVPPDWQLDPGAPSPMPQPTLEGPQLPTEWTEQAGEQDSGPAINIPWQAALAVLLVIIGAVVTYLLRRMPKGMFARHRSLVVGGSLDDALDQANELRKAAETASAALDGQHATGGDAVIEAWLALEAAADASGVHRRRSQTPSEFTSDLLRRHHADVAATTRLRELYHRARFSSHPDITADDVAAARAALRIIIDTIDAIDAIDAIDGLGRDEPAARTAVDQAHADDERPETP